jgi:hypothetical protein
MNVILYLYINHFNKAFVWESTLWYNIFELSNVLFACLSRLSGDFMVLTYL